MTPGRDRLASFVSPVFARAAARGLAAVGPLSVLGALMAAAACNRENAPAAAPPPMAPLVTAATAVSRAVPTYLDEIGRNGAFESVTVTPQVPGRIVQRHFQDGAQLAKGQLLFTVDPRPYQAQLNSAKAQLAETRAALDLAATQLKMYASITDERAVSALDLETKRNSVAVDEAQVQAAQAAVENAQLHLDYCYVHSPIDGRAGARLVDVGNVDETNTTALLLIQRIDPIYAAFTVTERDLPQVQPQMASGTLQEVALGDRSEEHTSELQSRQYLVCRLLLEKKKKTTPTHAPMRRASHLLLSIEIEHVHNHNSVVA